MQDKLRKGFRWIWYNKERMVLVIMVGFLMYRVYQVVSPPEAKADVPLRAPGAPEADCNCLPPSPSVRPPMSVPGDYASLVQRNPFWYHARMGGETDAGVEEVDIPITLIRIQETGGRLRAQLQTESTKKWYDEGEKFEQFELVDIDEAAQTVTVYIEQLGRRKTISVNE